MVYDVKADEHGNVVKFKARLVALGYDMRKDEYKETYAPVARWTTLMIMIVLGWYYLMDIYLLDFKGAYLHSTRPKSTPVYLYDILGIKTPPDKMIYLNKGLYGTLDAGNLWRQTVEKLLLSNGYTQAINDPCLFYKTRTINGKTYKTYIATWVDDLLIVSNDPETKNMKKDFEEKGFEISHFDKINKYLGVNVNYDKEKDILTFDQCDYIDEILQNANMQDEYVDEHILDPSIARPKSLARAMPPNDDFRTGPQIIGNEVVDVDVLIPSIARPKKAARLSKLQQVNVLDPS